MRKIIDKCLESVLVTLMATMLLSVLWQILSRYIFKTPSTFSDEITSFSLIWIGLLGSAYATGKKLHLAIDLIPEKMLRSHWTIFNYILNCSVIVFAFCILIIGGSRLCYLTFQFEQSSAALQIPLWIIYTVIPVTGLLVCYYAMEDLLKKYPNH